MSASLKADPAKVGQSWQLGADFLCWIDAHAWIVLPAIILAIGLTELVRKMIGPPFVWETIHRLLDQMREDVFGSSTDPIHYHRVTLFKYVKWRFGWRADKSRPRKSGWLVPVERSGHTSQKTKVAFWAPDRADQAEGVAGQTWASRRIVQVSSLPDLGTDNSDQAFSAYANATWVSVEWLRSEPPLARSFCGIPVEIGGKLWGVVVLDSRNQSLIRADRSFRLLATALGKLLERT